MATSTQPSPNYSKEDLHAKLKEGPTAWNQWRTSLKDDPELDLSGEDLRGVNLCGGDLHKCHFTAVNLRGANLKSAILWDSTFKDAELFETDLRETDLCGADLSEAKGGLLAEHLAGADLTGAKLPEPISKLYEKLEGVTQISDSAKKLFLAFLAACLYSWLTIGTTKDVDLITNRASSPLPIIQTAIPIVGFYVVAPIILLCVYFYFHFYLQKLWEELAQLPAIFPDGKPLHQRADPWLFNDLVRAHFFKLKNDRPFLSYFEQFTSIVLAWGLVPITLLVFWIRYLPRHGNYGTYFHAAVFTLCTVSAVRLYLLARGTLRGHPRLTLKQVWERPSPYITLGVALLTLVGAVKLSQAIIYGTPQTRAVRFVEWFGYSPFANLKDADISIRPANWTGKKDEELDLVKGATLTDQDLRYANLKGAFLAKSTLDSVDLHGASFTGADLRGTVLSDTSMIDTDLEFAALSNATFVHVHLNHAHLPNVDLTAATLYDTDFTGTHVWAKIKFADLKDAYGLEPSDIRDCEDWQTAFFSQDMLGQLDLPPDHNEALQAYRDSKSQRAFDDAWIQKWRASKAKTDTNPK